MDKAREARNEALESERRLYAEARQLQEEARKAQEVAYRREHRLFVIFDQFRECMEKTCSDLNEGLLRERAARLELELQHAREAACTAAAERTQPTEVEPPTVSKYFASGF